jgi:phenylacetate-CoA ligase
LVLHVHKTGTVDDQKLCREINNRFIERTEIQPNRIVFHDADELRQLQGVGTQLKEQKIIDNRPKTSASIAISGNGNGKPEVMSGTEVAK